MVMWSQDQVEQELRQRGWYQDKKPINHGVQYVLTDGTPVDWYQSGKVVVRGKDTQIKREASQVFSNVATTVPSATQEASTIPPPKSVFIVYGHDTTARKDLEYLLLRWKLEPIVIRNLPPAGDTIIEKLEEFTDANFACVLLTPDDIGYPFGDPGRARPRARQNVVLELGMVLAKLGRKHVAILVKGVNLEKPSDIDGLIYIDFNEHVEEATTRLAATLEEAGFTIQVKDLI